MRMRLWLTGSLLICTTWAFAQETPSLPDKILSFPAKVFSKIDQKASDFENKLTKGTEKYLQKLKRQEEKLYRKLYKKDSNAAKEIFDDINAQYSGLQRNLQKPLGSMNSLSNVYSSRLDTLNTTMNFLQSTSSVNTGSLPNVNGTLDKFKALQGRLNASEQIRKALQQRRKLLQEKLQQFGLMKQFQKFKREVWYYQRQLAEYKELFENSSRLEARLTEWVAGLPLFRQFFANNSQLGNLFALPGRDNTSAAFAGLQTRAMVMQDITGRFGNTQLAQQAMQQGMGEAQGMLNELKGKMESLGSGSSDEELPDFKPNNERTKSLKQRIEIGINFQSHRANNMFPASTEVGLSAGYRFSEKIILGAGFSHRTGWGRGWNNISITHQGAGVRFFGEAKLKGSFWFSGGYELNYRSEIRSIDQLRDQSAWAKSGLVGISKVISLKTKFFKKTSAKLLWDFMSYRQVPQTQAIIFRIGYNF